MNSAIQIKKVFFFSCCSTSSLMCYFDWILKSKLTMLYQHDCNLLFSLFNNNAFIGFFLLLFPTDKDFERGTIQ